LKELISVILIGLMVLVILLHIVVAETSALPLQNTLSNSIIVDGNPSEWGLYDCTYKAPGLYLETINDIPQWIWCDPEGDERTDFASPDLRADLVQFRITADENFLYGLIIVKDMDFGSLGVSGATATLITVNRNGTGNGEWFGLLSDTMIDGNAYWSWQIIINLGSAGISGTSSSTGLAGSGMWGAPFYVVDASWNFIVDEVSLMAANIGYDTIEFMIAWSTLGGVPGGPMFFLRLGLITGRGYGNGEDYGDLWDIGGGYVSDALDAITTTGPNTWDEVGDGVVNYYIDLYFMTTPPYYPIPEPFILVPIAVIGALGTSLALLLKKSRKMSSLISN